MRRNNEASVKSGESLISIRNLHLSKALLSGTNEKTEFDVEYALLAELIRTIEIGGNPKLVVENK